MIASPKITWKENDERILIEGEEQINGRGLPQIGASANETALDLVSGEPTTRGPISNGAEKGIQRTTQERGALAVPILSYRNAREGGWCSSKEI